MCVDYRVLNDITKEDAFPILRVDEYLDALGRSKLFSFLYLASCYYQVAIKLNDRENTAFTMPFGLLIVDMDKIIMWLISVRWV